MTKPDYMRDLERSAPARLAVQVGEQPTCLDIAVATRSAVAATIERCAQVADGMAASPGYKVAAAIRKLKEEK